MDKGNCTERLFFVSRVVYLQQLQHIGVLVEHLLQLVQNYVVTIGATRVGPHSPQGEVEPLAAGVPLDGDRAALCGPVAQYQFAVIVQSHL